tara:strand:- start:43 stop:1704 length:1662 start_codon:yes stop_codon:yes gene_type:complete
MQETKVYREFCEEVTQVIKDPSLFMSDKIKILQKQMGIGKSFFMGERLPHIIKEEFDDIRFIIRIAPTCETADDDFIHCINYPGYQYQNLRDIRSGLDNFLNIFLRTKDIFVFSITHTRFTHEYENFLKHADKSVLFIEEAHQFLAVGDDGNKKYGWGTGYPSPFDAAVAKRIKRWIKVNPRVLAFTATPTIHHKADLPGYGFDIPDTNEKLSDCFTTCNQLSSLDNLLETQSWVNNTISYDFKQRDSQDSVRESIYDAIDSLFAREKKLEILKKKDKNIHTKLTGLFMCGYKAGVWGCPMHRNDKHHEGMVEIIANYLRSKGYDEDLQMIATLQEDGGSDAGNRIWDLSGDKRNCEKVKSFDEIKERQLDPNDPLRYLIVLNRARSGISINNLGAIVIGVVRDPAYSRTHIPLQVLGRLLRSNPGTGSLITKRYCNNLTEYISSYPIDYNVDVDVMVETMKIANKFDIWYPVDTHRKALDVWGDAVRELRESYCNSVNVGHEWLHRMTCTKPPLDLLPLNLDNDLLCPHCGKSIYNYIEEKVGDGTLMPFFD